MAEKNAEMEKKDREMADKNTEIEVKIADKNAEIFMKDGEIAKKDAEIFKNLALADSYSYSLSRVKKLSNENTQLSNVSLHLKIK